MAEIEWCSCIQGTGRLKPYFSDHNIVTFTDKFRMIDTAVYENGKFADRRREFILSEKEYFKRRLKNE